MDQIEFEVGGKYENEQGVYEVVSMDTAGDAMVIQWESGNKIPTQISFQRRVLERRQIEKNLTEKKRKVKSPTGAKKRSGHSDEFDGFQKSDFSEKLKGTVWRSKQALGGAVTVLLETDGLRFDSWAVSRMNRVHWQDLKHHGFEDQWLQAKLFARLDEHNLYYGFYIERSDENSPRKTQEDWDGFSEWLKIPENESWLRETVEKNELYLYDQYGDHRPFSGKITAVNGGWHLVDGDKKENISSLASFFEQLPRNNWLDLQIAKIVEKDIALLRGSKIAEDIAGVFQILLPLYKTAITEK